MKKAFQILSFAVIVLTAVSCESIPTTPSGIVNSIFKVAKETPSLSEAFIQLHADSKTSWVIVQGGSLMGSNLIAVSSLNAIVNQDKKVADYSIKDKTISGDSALVTVKVKFTDGSEMTDYIPFVKERNGEWKIKLNNL